MNRKRIALFGGSFNPIHNGHISLAQQVIANGLADEVWLLVSPQNPLKKQDSLLDENQRLKMARIALKNSEGIKASDFEFHLPRPSYTWNTLQALAEAYPNYDFTLLIGADNWVNFSRWYRAADIVRRYPILIYPRNNFDLKADSYPATVRIINAPIYPYSSTDIRDAIAIGKDVSSMVPSQILEYVIEAYSPKE